jgi:hypothetical protein
MRFTLYLVFHLIGYKCFNIKPHIKSVIIQHDSKDDANFIVKEPMFSISYDPLENPNQESLQRDLEDSLIERGLKFYDNNMVNNNEKCYLVGLDDKSLYNKDEKNYFSMEESLTELSELAGAAGLKVVG